MEREDELLVAEICDSIDERAAKELDDLDFGWCSNCNDSAGNNGNTRSLGTTKLN